MQMQLKPNKAVCKAEAQRIWRRYGFNSPNDLVLEDLAMTLGILVRDDRLDSAVARLVRDGDRALVRVSDRIQEPGRRRFAIAHEIGHWLLHRKQSQLLACTNEDMLAAYGSSPFEVEASVFAGALLMPQHLFIERTSGRRPTRDVITDLCEYFDTTLTATAMRYVEASNDYYAFVVSERNKIRWWRASDSFMNLSLWIECGSSVPANSAAAAFFRGETVPSDPQELDLVDWLGELEDIDGDTIIEQAFPMPRYGQVISLLWLP